jgi:glycine betaine/choline ABC-type transport system substrate-binding protein
VDRRGFLLGATGLLAAGCARVPPPGTVPSVPTPPTAPAAPPLAVGTDGTPAGDMLAELLAGSLRAKGRQATVQPAGLDWRAALASGDLAAVPGFAGTLWDGLSGKDEPPATGDLLADLAELVSPEVGVFSAPGLDGGLVWLVTTATAGKGITSLSRVASWSRGRRAAIPSLARSRGDGVPGLRTVYRAVFAYDVVEAPPERAARLAGGQAAVAAFRRTEYTGTPGLVALVDPEKLGAADPGVVLVNNSVADAEPDHVLALDAVARAITTDSLLDLQAQVAAGGTPSGVADRWLQEQGIA